MSANVLDLLTSNVDLLDKLEGSLAQWRRESARTATASARDLARIIEAGLLGVRARNARAADDVRNGAADPDAVLSLNQKAFLLRELIRILELSSHRSLHPVLTPAIQGQLTSLGIKGEVLVSGLLSSNPLEEYSYEVLTLNRDLFDAFADKELLDEVSWPLLVFRAPSPPAEWPLFHSLMFHEIGHPLFLVHRGTLVAPNTAAEVEAAVAAAGTDLFKQYEALEQKRVYIDAALRWTAEVFSDAVGTLLVGPGFLSSLTRMLTAFRTDVASETHPPTILRIGFIIDTLREHGLIEPLPDVVKSIIGAWDADARRVTNFIPARNSHSLFRTLPGLLARELRGVHKQLVAQTAGILGQRVLTPGELCLDLERGRRLLHLRIPPIEARLEPELKGAPAPLDTPRIFSSCWAAYYLAAQEGRSLKKALTRCSDTLLDSLDATESVKAWSSAS